MVELVAATAAGEAVSVDVVAATPRLVELSATIAANNAVLLRLELELLLELDVDELLELPELDLLTTEEEPPAVISTLTDGFVPLISRM